MKKQQRKEMLQEIYRLAKEAGFTVQHFSKTSIALHPKTEGQKHIALEIRDKFAHTHFSVKIADLPDKKIQAKIKKSDVMKFKSWNEFRRKNKELGLGLFTKKDLNALNLQPGPDTPKEKLWIAYETHYQKHTLYKNEYTLPIKRREKQTVLHSMTLTNLCAALYRISKSAKASRDTKISAYSCGNYSQVSMSKKRELSLYDLKGSVIRKMEREGLLSCRGVHVQVGAHQDGLKHWLMYYIPIEEGLSYSFHVLCNEQESRGIEFLGEIDWVISAEKEEELLLLNFDEAELLLDTYLGDVGESKNGGG